MDLAQAQQAGIVSIESEEWASAGGIGSGTVRLAPSPMPHLSGWISC